MGPQRDTLCVPGMATPRIIYKSALIALWAFYIPGTFRSPNNHYHSRLPRHESTTVCGLPYTTVSRPEPFYPGMTNHTERSYPLTCARLSSL